MSVTLITGPMKSKKSKTLIDIINEVHGESNHRYLVFKPTKDKRDGLYVKSRVYDKVIKAVAWDQEYKEMVSIFDYMVMGFSLTNPDERKSVFFDEFHFLSVEEATLIVNICDKYEVDLYVSGLLMNFKMKPFNSVLYLNDIADNLIMCNAKCENCNEKNGSLNMLFNNGEVVLEGQEIQPGDEEYKVMCQDCVRTLI